MPGQGLPVANITIATAAAAARVTAPASIVLTVGQDCPTVAGCVATANNLTGNGSAPLVSVYVPAGLWPMPSNQQLSLGGGVTLVGAGATSTTLQWDDNVVTDLPSALVTGAAPGTAWMVANVSLLVTSPVQRALVLDVCSGCVVSHVTVNVTLDLQQWPTVGPQNPIWVRSSTGWLVEGSLFVHSGNCTAAYWPANTGFYISSSEQGVFVDNTVLCYCQGWSVDSSSRIAFIGDTMTSLSNDSEGNGFSSFDASRQLTNLYMGDTTDIGNPAATKRWESFTTDGPNGAFFGVLNPGDGDGTHLYPQPNVDTKDFGYAPGQAVIVVDGVGLGQVRGCCGQRGGRVLHAGWHVCVCVQVRVLVNATRTPDNVTLLTVDSPFAPPLAPSTDVNASVITVVAWKGNFTFGQWPAAWTNNHSTPVRTRCDALIPRAVRRVQQLPQRHHRAAVWYLRRLRVRWERPEPHGSGLAGVGTGIPEWRAAGAAVPGA